METFSTQKTIFAAIAVAILSSAPLSCGQCTSPGNPSPDQEVMFNVTWGDDSGSKSESYNLSIPNAEPAQLPASEPGKLTTTPLALRKGKSYTLTMSHVSTTLETAPDYDYTLKIDGQGGGNQITVLDKGLGGKWLVYDENQIGGVHTESDEFYAAGKKLFLLPVEVVELSPKTKDEDGNEIAGSEKPNIGNPLTPFVEIDPNANKIAHREIKVKIGDALKDKKVTWTLEALPGATPATIRGQWEDSPTHKDRFEASTAYGANGFRKVSQTTGETTVGADGHTAIRVNVPPIGLNQMRIKIQIEGIDTPIDLIDMEVPGVVVIDPGHGGNDSGAVGRTDTSILEKDLALEYSLSLRQEVIAKFAAERHGLRMVMTRKTTGEYMENSARANLARDKGADVFISVHFNSGASSARGTETLVRGDSNVNEPEDTTLANLFLTRTLAAVQSQDAAAINRGVKNYAWSQSQQKNVPSQWAVLSDSGYGNTKDYHPIRGSIVEVEFLSHETALESVKLSNTKGTAIKTKFATDVSTDIYNNILNQP